MSIQQTSDGTSQEQLSPQVKKTAQTKPDQKSQQKYTYTSPKENKVPPGGLPPKKPTRENKLGPVKSKQGIKSPKTTREGVLEPVKAKQRPITTNNKTPKQESTDQKTKTHDDSDKVAISRGFMMLTSEGGFDDGPYTAKRPHWPGQNSGVTIGFGFDIGAAFPATQVAQAKICLVNAGIDSATADKLAKYAGVKGSAAQAPANKLRKEGIIITNEQALKLLDVSNDIFNKAVHTYAGVDSNQVHPALEEVFTDLAYAWWNFSYTKKVYAKVKGKPASDQFKIAADFFAAESKNHPRNELLQMIKNYLYGIKGYLDQGKEVEVSKHVMSVKELLASETFETMDITTKGVGKGRSSKSNKGSKQKAILTGKRFTPKPQVVPTPSVTKAPKVTHSPLPKSKNGFSVGMPGGKYNASIINFPADVRRIQQKLLEVGLLSQTDYNQEYPKEQKSPKKIPAKKPDYRAVKKLNPQGLQEVKNHEEGLLEKQKQAALQQTREALLAWLNSMTDEQVRSMAENPTLKTTLGELVLKSGLAGVTSRGEMIAQLMTLRGQSITPLTRQEMPTPQAPTPTEIPYVHYLTNLEQEAMEAYGKIPVGVSIPFSQLTKTIAAIQVFQREVKGGTTDGRIDPNGATLGQLMGASKESVAAARKAYLERKKQEEENQKKENAKEIIKEIEEGIVENLQDFIISLDKSLVVTFLKMLVGVKSKNSKQKKLNIKNAVLADLMKKSELSPKEIAIARKLIDNEKDIKKRGDLYLKLQYKVPYISQRDSKAYPGIADAMCNMSSMAMGLSTLGIDNPKPNMQYDDALENIRADKGYGSRMGIGQMNVAGHFGMSFDGAGVYGYSTSNTKMGGYPKTAFRRVPFVDVTDLTPSVWQNYSWFKKNISPFLEKGLAVTLGIWDKSPADNGHIVHLVGIESKGLRVHDPYGRLDDFDKPYGKGWDKNTTNGKGSKKGRLNLWHYEDLAGKEVYLAYLRILQPKK